MPDSTRRKVWRRLQRCHLRLPSAQMRRFRPDPAYATKEVYMLHYLHEVAQAPTPQVLVFLDEMGYSRWHESAHTIGH